jgi:transposase
VSIVNPAQIRDFARTKLGRNKTDQVDAVHIREHADLFMPAPGSRLREQCGVCANSRQSGMARLPA